MATTAPATPAGRSFAAILTLASGATFLAILDATAANLAVADMAHDFTDASVAGLSWVLTLYAVAFAALLAPAGRLADVLGRRGLFMAGVGLFTTMSLLCALAPDLPVLLVARTLQGAGAAAMIPASLAIILVDAPPERRASAIGLWSATSSLAAAVGPSLGGVLIDAFSWRAVFLINVPVGLVLVWYARIVPGTAGRGTRLPDLLGTLLLGTGIGLVALGVTEGATWGWGDARTLGCLVGGTALALLAVHRSTRHPVPAVETSLWRNRTFANANVTSVFYGLYLYAWLLGGVLFLVNVWHYSELKAGLAVTPGAVGAALTAVVAGRVTARRDPRIPVLVGSLIVAGVGFWMLVATPDHPRFLAFWLPAGILSGVGMGATSTGVSSAGALSVSPLQFAGATGLNMTARQLGGALGIAALATILTGQEAAAPDAYRHAFGFCAVVAVLAALAGLGLRMPAQRAARAKAASDAAPAGAPVVDATTTGV